MREFAAGHNHKQPGDPKKLSKAILMLLDSQKPPVRLPPWGLTQSQKSVKKMPSLLQLREWIDLAVSTDHDDVRK